MADDQPIWGNNRGVATTPGVAIVVVDLGDNFTIKGHHLSMIKDRQFDGRARADPHKHIIEFVEIYVMFRYGNTNANTIKLKLSHHTSSVMLKRKQKLSTHGKIEALTTKIYSQYKDTNREMKEIRDGCNNYGCPHPLSNYDDKPIGGPEDEEANYAYGGYRGGRYQGNYYGRSSRNWRDRQLRDDNQNS
nr:reverse transcriptase domain-containing protein [Tanacetum cinerariifolium]